MADLPGTPRDELRRFVRGKFPNARVGDDDDIFALGLANSLFAMELVLFVEKLLGAPVPNDELSLDHFRTVDGMARLVERLGATAPAGRP